jgi:UDP-glucose 4-epimerase
MRALVTGGAGFIGSTLVDRLLAEGHAVDVVDDLSTGSLANLADARTAGAFSFHRLDVRRPEVVELIAHRKPDVVFHLAAQTDVRVSLARPVFDAEVNILGSLQILEGARQAGVRKVVFASSGGTIYGSVAAKDLPLRETQPQRPLSPYGVAKKVIGDYLSAYRDLHGLEFTALALANVYGPRQNGRGEAGVVAMFADNLLDGRPCVIYGDGRQTRDLVYVDDVVDAFARAGERGSGLLINIGTGVETSVNDLFMLVGAAAENLTPATYLPARPGELDRNCLNPGRAELHLGWKPWTAVPAGVDATVRWLRDHRPDRDGQAP